VLGGSLLLRIPALVVGIVFHEFAHGYVADRMGDPTAKYSGRLTLNPVAHLDPIGILMLWIFGFGWAKPVPINPRNFRDFRRGLLFVSLAGPAMNLVLAFVANVAWRLVDPAQGSIVSQLFFWMVFYNLVLAAFNLIPVPPLDGSKILMALLPGRQARFFAQLQQYGWVILLILIFTGLIGSVLWPLISLLEGLLNFLTGLVI